MVDLAFNTYSLYAYHWFQINEVNRISTLGLQKPFQVGANTNSHGSGILQIWDLPLLEHS